MRPTLMLIALFAGLACSRPISAAEIEKIVISGKACPNCADMVVVTRDGGISLGAGSDVTTVNDPAQARDIIAALPLNDVRSKQPVLAAGGSLGVGLWVAYRDGTHDYSVVSVNQNGLDSVGKLFRWLQRASFQATQSVLGPRREAVRSSLVTRSLRSVELEMLGCYGACPRYRVVFDEAGDAIFHSAMPACEGESRAHVSFALVIDALLAANAPNLLPSYPSRVVDTEAVRLILETPAGRFVSEGSDSSTWDRAFVAAQSRLDQIVRMTNWSPAVDLTKCSHAVLHPAP